MPRVPVRKAEDVMRYDDFRRFCQHAMFQQVLNPTPLNPTPATCHKRKQKLRCNFWKVALPKLHYNIRFSAVRTSFLPKAALQRMKTALQH